MQINIQSHGFTATGALRALVTRRLQLALGCCADRVSRATVCLSDVNGPRGGVDKRCQIQVRLTALALLAWAAGFRRPPRQTFVVHGEETAALALAERLRAERGWTVTVPEPGQSVRL